MDANHRPKVTSRSFDSRKNGGPEFRDRQLSQHLLKRERRVQLHQPRGGIRPEERTEDAGGGGYWVDDPPEGL